jgi:hypothetical protein
MLVLFTFQFTLYCRACKKIAELETLNCRFFADLVYIFPGMAHFPAIIFAVQKWDVMLTREQMAIIDSMGDIKINAVAGSGKTTTLIEYAKARPAHRICSGYSYQCLCLLVL